MIPFTGVFHRKIDSKGRVMLPTKILDSSPWPYATAWLSYGEERAYAVAPISPGELTRQAAAESLSVDPIELTLKEGLLRLTSEMRERLGENALCIVGVHDHIELWPVSVWERDDPRMDPQTMQAELEKLFQADKD